GGRARETVAGPQSPAPARAGDSSARGLRLVRRRLRGQRDVDGGDGGRLLERAPEQLLRAREAVAQRVAVHVEGGRGGGDVEVVREVGADRLVQRRVLAQDGEDLLDLRREPLRRDLAHHERAQVEVLE